MALKSPKRGNRTECHYWDYSFHWTDLHSSADDLKSLIYNCDSLADECVERLSKVASADDRVHKQPFKRDLYGLLRDHADEDPKLCELWTEINTVPEWVDWDQIRRGQDIFFRYGLPILNVVSGCMKYDLRCELTSSTAKLSKLTRWDVRAYFRPLPMNVK